LEVSSFRIYENLGKRHSSRFEMRVGVNILLQHGMVQGEREIEDALSWWKVQKTLIDAKGAVEKAAAL
jgi:hypothetical protein